VSSGNYIPDINCKDALSLPSLLQKAKCRFFKGLFRKRYTLYHPKGVPTK